MLAKKKNELQDQVFEPNFVLELQYQQPQNTSEIWAGT